MLVKFKQSEDNRVETRNRGFIRVSPDALYEAHMRDVSGKVFSVCVIIDSVPYLVMRRDIVPHSRPIQHLIRGARLDREVAGRALSLIIENGRNLARGVAVRRVLDDMVDEGKLPERPTAIEPQVESMALQILNGLDGEQ
jgi:hypothetical protein